jgi:hypothetical protein
MTATNHMDNLTLELPEGWFVIEADPSARRTALVADVEAWAREAPDRMAHRKELVEILSGFGAEAEEKSALFAAVFWEPGENGPTAANVMVFEGERSAPDSVEAEVAAALVDLAQPDPADHGPRDVSQVQLPIGPAVRVRFLASSPDDRAEGEPALVLDVTQVWVPLQGQPPMVIISGTTPTLIAGDDVASVVDAVAGSVRYTPG